MKIPFKGILAVLGSAGIAVAAGLSPLGLFEQQEKKLLEQVYPLTNASGKIDPQAEEIYLVKEIRDIYQNGSDVYGYGYGDETMDKRLREQVPAQLDILTASGVLSESQYDWMQEDYYWGDWPINYAEVVVNEILIYPADPKGIDDYREFFFLLEERTNKLISLQFRRNNDVILDKNAQMTIMEKYISYLDLDILGDWVYNEIGYVSQKAQLQVICQTTSYAFLLKIIPVDFYRQNALTFSDYLMPW